MSNKKTLKEVFEFFPNAKWITQDKGRDGIISIHVKKPEIERTWCAWDHWDSDIDSQSHIDKRIMTIDWGGRRTWEQRCVSREEILTKGASR